VRNIPSFSIAVLPADLPKAETPAVAQRLAGLLEMDAGEIEATIQEARADPYQHVTIKSNVPRETALIIEEHYGRPMDIEWGKDGVDGRLYILQARPETVTIGRAHG